MTHTPLQTRKEKIMGWYHSHPFDVAAHSNCFFSNTDVTNQLSWQMSEDRAGTPWLGIVVDPLRSQARGEPELGAYRCYPPQYTPPPMQGPDGKIWTDHNALLERWGQCYARCVSGSVALCSYVVWSVVRLC